MKCNACNYVGAFIRIDQDYKTSLTGWHPSKGNMGKIYLYACPACGTVKIETTKR